MRDLLISALVAAGLGLIGSAEAYAAVATPIGSAAELASPVQKVVVTCRRITVCRQLPAGRVCKVEKVCKERW